MEQATNALWAIDPFDTDKTPTPESIDFARAHLGGSFVNTTPLFVCGPHFSEVLMPLERVRHYLQEFSTGPIRTPEIIRTTSEKKSEWVEEVLKAAKEKNSQLIILTNHGRRGLSKFLVGSFAESLLEISPLPVLLLGQEVAEDSRKDRALFATDFSSESREAFFEFIRFLAPSFKELLLYHAVAMPSGAVVANQLGGAPFYFSPELWLEQVNWAKSESKNWLSQIKQMDLPRSLHIHTVIQEAFGDPGPAILKLAEREGISLIGMNSHGKKQHSFFFSSVTKDVLSSDQAEVWACGPQFGSSFH
ncbi:MAG: universal stress protein [Pseudobdellovibrionaceae bacterium]